MNPLTRLWIRHLKQQEFSQASRAMRAIVSEPDSSNRQRLGEQLAAQRPAIAPYIAKFLRQVDEVYAGYSPQQRREIAQAARTMPPVKLTKRSPR
jgi:hypothetical protein